MVEPGDFDSEDFNADEPQAGRDARPGSATGGNEAELPAQGPCQAGKSEPDREAGDKKAWTHYPHIVIRFLATVYTCEPVKVEKGPLGMTLRPQLSSFSFPEYDPKTGRIPRKVRKYFAELVLKEVRRRRWWMCIVWGPRDCTYVDLEGFKNSREPPFPFTIIRSRHLKGADPGPAQDSGGQ